MVTRNINSTPKKMNSQAVGPMLASQNSVPPLPIPTLESTAHKYLETVRPHLTSTQYQSTQSAVADFLKSDHVKTLQKRLQQRASEPGINSKNWLIQWWNEAAYMGYRDPVVVYVSYFYLHVQTLGEAWKEGDSSSRKAAL